MTVYLPTSGLTLGDLTLSLVQDSATPPVAVAVPGTVALTEAATGDYSITGLPDVAAGSGEHYYLRVTYGVDTWTAAWPTSTRTPSEVIATPLSTQLVAGAGEASIVEGDTAPDVVLLVYGLTEDPDGSTVTWELYDWSDAAVAVTGTTSITGAALDDGTWMATVRYSWAAADTTGQAGSRLWGRFKITLPGGDVFTRPAAPKTITLRVYP